MGSVSKNVHPLMPLHYGVARTNMEAATSSEAGSVNAMQSVSAISSLGWHPARSNALNLSATRGMTWRDVASLSSPHPSSSLKNTTAVDRGPASMAGVETTRSAVQAAPSLPYSDFAPVDTATTTSAVVSPMQQAALARGVNGFRDFVAQLPFTTPKTTNTTTTTSTNTNVSTDGLSKEESQSPLWEATNRPRLSLDGSVNGIPPLGNHSPTQTPTSNNLPMRGETQLPPSTVPSHCIHTEAHMEHAQSLAEVTQLINDVSTSPLSCRVCATVAGTTNHNNTSFDPHKANDFSNELVQIQNNESGFVIAATRRRQDRETSSGAVKECQGYEEDDGHPPPVFLLQLNTVSAPGSCPPDPFHERGWATSRNSEFMTSSNGNSDGNSNSNKQQAGEAFQRYLEQTRETVLNAEATEDERANALDALMVRSKELFDLLDCMHSSLVDGTDRRRYVLLASSTNAEGVTRSAPKSGHNSSLLEGGGVRGTAPATTAAMTAFVAGTSMNSEEVMSSNGVEQLTFTSRAVGATTQLPNLGPSAALRLFGGFERGRRNSFNSCSTTSQAYIDTVNNYYVLQLIGIGATGRAYLVLDRKTNNYYAMKTVAKRTRQSAMRHFPPRPPSSLSEECSVMEGARTMSSLPESSSKLPPRYMNGGGSASAAVAAAPAPNAAVDGIIPSSNVRTACFPAATAATLGVRSEPRTNVYERGLREADMDSFAQTISHNSGIVIPYVESVVTGELSSVSGADGIARDNAVQAVLVAGESSRLAATLQSSSFAPRTNIDAFHVSNNSSARPPVAPLPLRAATQGLPPKDKAASSVDVEMPAVEREIRVMRRVQNHAHVVKLKEVIEDDDDDCVHLIMTYAANGPLTIVHGFDPVHGIAACNVVRPFSRCARLLRQLADALIYVHRQRIVHNDVKPDNILLTDSDNILLTDFGESVLIPKQTQSAAATTPLPQQQQQHSPRVENLNATVSVPHNRWKSSRASCDSWTGGAGGGDFNEQSVSHRFHGVSGTLNAVSQMLMTEVSFLLDSSMFLAAGVDGDGRLNGDRIVVGSPAFAAPELIDSSTCSFKSDTWSFGVVLYAIIFGRLPFAGPSISGTFDAILHAPLTFPPLDQVPQSADLTEAAYEQWVTICSQLLVREPQQRLSLNAMLRHPFFHSTIPHPTSPKSTSTEALSSSRRGSTGYRQHPPDSAANYRGVVQGRQSSPSAEQEGDLTPISRTIHSKPSCGDVSSPQRSVSNESLSCGGSPTLFSSRVIAAVEGRDLRTPQALSLITETAAGTAASTSAPAAKAGAVNSPPSVSPQVVIVPTPPRAVPATAVSVPVPPAVRCEAVSSSPSKSTFGLPPPQRLRRPSEGSISNLNQASQNSITQLPSVMPSKGIDTLPPSCPSVAEDPSTALPTPPYHLREKTLIYYQSSELPPSGCTASRKKSSFFGSNRCCAESRGKPSEQPPKLGTPLLAHTAASTQSFEKEEMLQRVLNSRELIVASTTFCPPSPRCSGEASNVPLTPECAATTARVSSQTQPLYHQLFTMHSRGNEEEDRAAGDLSVGGTTCEPQDDPNNSANLNISRQDAATDYYSYWNDSDGEADEGADESSGAEEAETIPPRVAAAAEAQHGRPHPPHDSQITWVPMRRGLLNAQPCVVPVLSNREEVPGRQRRGRNSVMRTKREKKKPSEERRPSRHDHPQPQPLCQYEQSTSRMLESVKEGSLHFSSSKRSLSKSSSRCSLPSITKRRSLSFEGSKTKEGELKPKRPSISESKSWFKRRH